MTTAKLFSDLETYLGGLGFEPVSLKRGGGRGRAALRLRIDRTEGAPEGSAVTVEDCARVSRALQDFLEGREDVPLDFELEVSSAGVERPLVRSRDYLRFAGREVRVKGYAPLAGLARSLEGRLVGLETGGDGDELVMLEVEGDRVEVPLTDIASAHLVYRWEDDL